MIKENDLLTKTKNGQKQPPPPPNKINPLQQYTAPTKITISDPPPPSKDF